MEKRIPVLTVIAGRPARRFEETHYTQTNPIAEWGEAIGKVVMGALAFVALTWAMAVMILSLGGPR